MAAYPVVPEYPSSDSQNQPFDIDFLDKIGNPETSWKDLEEQFVAVYQLAQACLPTQPTAPDNLRQAQEIGFKLLSYDFTPDDNIEITKTDNISGNNEQVRLTKRDYILSLKDALLINLSNQMTNSSYELPTEFLFALSKTLQQAQASRILDVKEQLSEFNNEDIANRVEQTSILFLNNLITFPSSYAKIDKNSQEIVEMLASTESKTFRESIITLSRNQRVSDLLVSFLEKLASNYSLYLDRNTHSTTSINRRLEDTIEADSGLRDAIERLTQQYDGTTYQTKSLISILNSVLLRSSSREQIRILLLNMLDAYNVFVPLPSAESGITYDMLLNQAFQELDNPHPDQESILRIVKMYLIIGNYSYFSEANKNRLNLLTAIINAGLEEYGKLKQNERMYNLLMQYFNNARSYFPYLEHIHVRSNNLADLDDMMTTKSQGDPLTESSPYNPFRKKLDEGCPIIYYQRAGLGDAILTIPVIKDLAETIKVKGRNNQIYFVIHDNLVPLAEAMLADYRSFVKVVKLSDTAIIQEGIINVDYSKIVSFIQQGNQARQQHNHEPININEGIFLAQISGQNDLRTIPQFPNEISTYTFAVPYHMTVPDINTSTFRRSRQVEISEILNTVIFDPQDRDSTEMLRQKLLEHLATYASKHPELVAKVKELKEINPNGYISLIRNGSTDVKILRPHILQKLAKGLSKFCTNNHVGIAAIQGLSDDAELFRQEGITYTPISITDDIESTLYILSQSIGGIGPDTFLVHAMEYFGFPVINIHVDSDSEVWRLRPDENPIDVHHPIANWITALQIPYAPYLSSSLGTISAAGQLKRLFPFDNSDNLHPLLAAMQDAFYKDLERGLNKLIEAIKQRQALD